MSAVRRVQCWLGTLGCLGRDEKVVCGLVGCFVCGKECCSCPSQGACILSFLACVNVLPFGTFVRKTSLGSGSDEPTSSGDRELAVRRSLLYYFCAHPEAGNMVGHKSNGQKETHRESRGVVQKGMSATESARGGAGGRRHWLRLGGRHGACTWSSCTRWPHESKEVVQDRMYERESNREGQGAVRKSGVLSSGELSTDTTRVRRGV